MIMERELKKLKDQVEYCLREIPETRNSDITLTLAVWKEFHGVTGYINVGKLYDLPREDNVKRVRAKFQNELKMFLPTVWEVAKKRGIKREEWEEFIREFNEDTLQPSLF